MRTREPFEIALDLVPRKAVVHRRHALLHEETPRMWIPRGWGAGPWG